MGKSKKHRARKNKENEMDESSDDGLPRCSHITKAVNFAAMRKALLRPACTIGECTSCTAGTSKGQKGKREEQSTAVSEEGDQEPHTTIWVCLQCGHQGCDRNSQEKHALKHYGTPHSGIHCLVINLTTWATWCYMCDDEVVLDNKRIQECMDFLRKQTRVSHLGASQPSNVNSGQTPSQSGSQTDPSVDSGQTGGSAATSGPGSGQPFTIRPQVGTKSSDIACQRVKGLSNLGNTCFFNAVMQNMCQTPGIEALLTDRCSKDFTWSVGGWKDDHDDSGTDAESDDDDDSRKVEELSPIDIQLGEVGPLTLSLMNFVQEMSTGNGKNTVSPNGLFGNICRKAPRFRGFQQQDSHELLRYLIDVVRNEEIKRAQGGILKYFKLPEKTNPKHVDDDIKMKIRDYGRQVKFTFVDSLFGGQLVSTITCEECGHVSQIAESFLDLSLPVTEEKPQRPNQILGGRHKEPAAARDAVKEADEERPPLKGIDGFAERSDKPSKYQERKNRKHAKREAKKKARNQNARNPKSKRKSDSREEEEDKEEVEAKGEEEEGAREVEEGGEDGVTDNPAEQDPTNLAGQNKEEDADVEDNVESEAPRLQMAAADMESNLSASTNHIHRSHSNNSSSNLPDSHDDSEGDLDIKSGTHKEIHILPRAYLQSGQSHQVSSGTEFTGIKEGKHCEVEKLSNDLFSLTLNDSGLGRTEGGSDEPSAVHREGRGDTSTDISVSSPDTNHSVLRDANQSCEVDSRQTEESLGIAKENGLTCLENDTKGQHINSSESPTLHKSLPNTSDSIDGQNKRQTSDESLTDFYKEARHKSKTTLAARYQPSSKECSVMSCLNQFTSAELLTGPNKVKCKACTKARSLTPSPEKEKKKSEAVRCNASKQYLVLMPPAVLTLHLKRFEQVVFGCRKVNRHVEFPPLLDLAPYCSALCQGVGRGQRRVVYSLYGVVEHSGRLHGGHYTAYVKVRPGLGPVNRFLQTQLAKPHHFIHKYVEHLSSGVGEGSEQPAAEPVVPEGRWFHVSDSSVSAVSEATVLKAQAYLLFYERVC